MNNDTFWTGLLQAFQSSPDVIKALWLLIPPAFVLAIAGLAMRYRLAARRVKPWGDGELIYTVVRNREDQMLIYRHGQTPSHHEAPLPIGMDADRALLESTAQADFLEHDPKKWHPLFGQRSCGFKGFRA